MSWQIKAASEAMRAHRHYILKDHEPVAVSLLEWVAWFERCFSERIVAQDHVCTVFVSTVFLGVDHNFVDDGPPILFETMVFDAPDGDVRWDGQRMWRFPTWEAAEQWHKAVVNQLRRRAGGGGTNVVLLGAPG